MPSYDPYENIPQENRKYFQIHNINTTRLSIIIFNCAIWFYFITQYCKKLKPSDKGFKYIFFFILITIPYLLWAGKIMKFLKYGGLQTYPAVTKPKIEDPLWLPPDYGRCFDPKLTSEEAKYSIGKMNYKCIKKQYDYLQALSDEYISKAYYQLYTLFSIVLLLFTHIVRDHTSFYLNDNNPFIKNLIKYSILISLILLTSPILMQYYYYSLIMSEFYESLITMNVFTLAIFLAYIMYKLVKSGVDL